MRRLVALLMAACSAPTARPIDHHGSIPALALEITLSRTECFGRCPIYSVTIHGDGRVDWHGQKYVAAQGERHTSITRSQLAALAATIDRIGFFDLDEFGTPRSADPMRSIVICSDGSNAIVTIERSGQRHTTDNDHCNPSPATELEDQIEAVAQTARWISAPRK
jgi:uncharacterized protein DUF6438